VNDDNPLIVLPLHLALLSLLAIGGGMTILPDVHRLAVDNQHWMTSTQFAEIFAIAQASPGPNILYVALVGWRAAGLAGALVATAAICIPPGIITYFVTRIWDRFQATKGRRAIELGLAPVTIGVIFASSYILIGAVDQSWMAGGLTAATALFVLFTRYNPLWVLGIAALIGGAGYVPL
jgi:chromate transporter